MADAAGPPAPTVTAAIIAVGTELTRGRVADTNSAWLARRLAGFGVDVERIVAVPDRSHTLVSAVAQLLERGTALAVITGGLGPTSDDLTAPAVAEALGLDAALDPEALAAMKAAIGFDEPEAHQIKQATLPAGSRMLPPAGTAPGFLVRSGDTLLLALPGVPREMEEMWDAAVMLPEVRRVLSAPAGRETLALSLYGCGEPAVDAAVAEIIADHPLIEAGICSRYGEIELRLDFPPEEMDAARSIMSAMRERFSGFFFSEGGSAAAAVIKGLAAAGKTLAVAESCTGGLLAGALTDVSGASAVFRGGVVAYANDVKISQLGVRDDILENTGAVSRPVAQWMAVGARSRLGADYGIGITGIAGPSGGTAEKPVGLVYICASSPDRDDVRRFDFSGDRERIRQAAVISALHMLLALIAPEAEGPAAALT